MQNSEYELQAAEGTPNGEVETMSIEQLQKEKQDLEQQLTEKNKVRTPCTWPAVGPLEPCSPLSPLSYCVCSEVLLSAVIHTCNPALWRKMQKGSLDHRKLSLETGLTP